MDRKENDSMGLPFVEWQRKKPVYADRVCIDKLQFSTDVFPDAFGRDKAQPGLISIALSLREQFQSAAQTDALDQSTINYGTLSKAILKSIKQRSASGELIMMEQIWSLIGDLIPSESVEAVEIDIFLPKACMVGDGIGFKKSMTRGGYDSLVIYFKNIRTSTIIGVNAHERKLKQPVIANVWLDDPKEEISIPEHVRIVERILIEVIERSAFETLESLSTAVAERVSQDLFLAEKQLQVGIGVKISKPQAIPFAEAPSVEIYRRP